ncbi:MAG: hypothetical protein J0H82_27075 [Alphaproteobacteria bacterium]|nr:hypothetical protein [Alphaproteobacteria bacterium]
MVDLIRVFFRDVAATNRWCSRLIAAGTRRMGRRWLLSTILAVEIVAVGYAYGASFNPFGWFHGAPALFKQLVNQFGKMSSWQSVCQLLVGWAIFSVVISLRRFDPLDQIKRELDDLSRGKPPANEAARRKLQELEIRARDGVVIDTVLALVFFVYSLACFVSVTVLDRDTDYMTAPGMALIGLIALMPLIAMAATKMTIIKLSTEVRTLETTHAPSTARQ